MKTRIHHRALLLIACALALSLTAICCASQVEESALLPEDLSESDIIGVWQLTTLMVEGSSFAAEMLGIDMRYEFQADHTALGSYAGNLGDSGSAKETWTLDTEHALICVDGIPLVKVRCEDGTLFLLMDEEINPDADGVLVFTRPESS